MPARLRTVVSLRLTCFLVAFLGCRLAQEQTFAQELVSVQQRVVKVMLDENVMSAESVAATVVHAILLPPNATVETIEILPSAGTL